MCKVRISYKCGHFEETYHPCQYYKVKSRAPATKSFFRKVFGMGEVDPITPENCPARAGQAVWSNKCEFCWEIEEARRLQDSLRYEAEKRHLQKSLISQNREDERRQIQKWVLEQQEVEDPQYPFDELHYSYLCIHCMQEHRDPSLQERAANRGFCCAGGVDEWEETYGPLTPSDRYRQENANGPLAPIRRVSPTIYKPYRPPPNSDATYVPQAGEELFPVPRERDSISPSAIYAPTAGEELFPQPRNSIRMAELPEIEGLGTGIDWDRWNAAPQTSHGRIPPPPQQSPLPPSPRTPGIRQERFEELPPPPQGPLPPTPSSAASPKTTRSAAGNKQANQRSTSLTERKPDISRSRTRLPSPINRPSLGRTETEPANRGNVSLSRSGAIRKTNTQEAPRPSTSRRPQPSSRDAANTSRPSTMTSTHHSSRQSLPASIAEPGPRMGRVATASLSRSGSRTTAASTSANTSPPRGRQPRPQPQPSTPVHERDRSISPVSETNEHWERVLQPTRASSSRRHRQATDPFRSVASRLDAQNDAVMDAWTNARTREERSQHRRR